MHSKRAMTSDHDGAGDSSKRPDGRLGLPADLGSALMDFARRLANFGLGEVEDPLLDEFIDRRRRPRLQS